MVDKLDKILFDTLKVTPDQITVTDMDVIVGQGKYTVNIKGFVFDAPAIIMEHNTLMDYDKVIFNDPATIVMWKDGTKTVVRCDKKDDYSPITGLALCFMKKALSNSSRKLNDVLHEYKL